MAEASPATERRAPLSKERVLQAAVDLADRGGIEALSMRGLGQELGVEAMALYRHVRNKDDLLDGVVEVVIGEIEVLRPSGAWKSAIRQQVMTARQVMMRHPWAPPVIIDRPAVGPGILRYLDSVMAILRSGGFSLDLAHHTIHVMGSRIFGFTQDPFNDSADVRPEPEVAAAMARAMAVDYPHLAELAAAASHDGALGGCDDDIEFAFSLDLLLDGLERQHAAG